MPVITPTPITSLPAPPVKGQAGFNAAAELYLSALVNPFTPQVNAAIAATNANALSAEQSAISAAAAAAAANATQWASGTYSAGAAVWSPISTAAGTPAVYIRKEPGGASPTDPSNDPTNWVKYVPSNTTGGAVYTTSTTLTSGSPFAISISGGAGVWIKLPDATTLPTGIRHAVRNTGDNDLTVLDSTGATIGFIRPQCGTTIALSDSSTAAGKWVGDFEQIGVTADFQFGAAVAGLKNVKQIIQLDATRTMILTGGSSGQGLYAVVYDTATQSAGAAVLVRAAMYGAMAVKTAADQVLCVAFDGGNPGNLYATVLTVAGTSIAVNTAVTASITGQFTGVGNWVSVGGAWCFGYINNNNIGVVRAITISGTAPSIGGEQSAASSSEPRLYSAGSILRVIRVVNSSTIICTPYSLSGNILTAGTQASVNNGASNDYGVRSFTTDFGIGVIYIYGGNWVFSHFKISGTVESVMSVNLCSAGTLTAIDATKFAYGKISNSKFTIACAVNSDSSFISINNVSIGESLISAGTYITFASGAVSDAFAINDCKSSNINEIGFFIGKYGTQIMIFDCSAASPARSRVYGIGNRPTGSSAAEAFRNRMGVNNPQILSNNINTLMLGAFNGASYIHPSYLIGYNGIRLIDFPLFIRGSTYFRGENEQSTFVAAPIEGANGVSLQRIQIAQV